MRESALPLLVAAALLLPVQAMAGPIKPSGKKTGGSGGSISCPTSSCVDLTTAGASGKIGGAVFTQIDPQPTGTGVIDPFLRLQAKGTQQGYNTSARPFEFDQKNPLNFTHDLLTADVPVVTVGGIDYREFFLDINEAKNSKNVLLSLDELEIYQSDTGKQSDFAAGLGTKIYDLDATKDSWIVLNYALGHGSGSGDMSVLIPNSLFLDKTYTYLYSRFGDTYSSNAGFEEWWTKRSTPTSVPEPGLLSLLGAGIAAAFAASRRRRPATVRS